MHAALILGALLAQQTESVDITSGLAIGQVSAGGRAPVAMDAVQAQIVKGGWHMPAEGDKLQGPRGQQTWHKVTAGKDGWIDDPAFGGGYFVTTVNSPKAETMMLEAAGHTLVYINGVPRAGDPYGYGYLHLPVELRQGDNTLLFVCGRGRIHARLAPVQSALTLDTADLTLPDVVAGEHGKLMGAVVVANATRQPATGLSVLAYGSRKALTPLPTIPPMSVRKVRFDLMPPASLAGDSAKYTLFLKRDGKTLDAQDISVRIRTESQEYRRTFVSNIDGSVQYYAVDPALKPSAGNALVLTLHGASVEAQGQADAYGLKDWATIVAATNRRPYGFDWEDVGRIDALEVLDQAEKTIPHDKHRVHLTGHSMGGHGTWAVGTLYPDRFASIGPSAGWISFSSYAGGYSPRNPSPVEQMLLRSAIACDTLARVRNTLSEAVYVLHGDADDNVPVQQARTMKSVLEPIHKDFQYHEQPGAGHWWGGQCVDWPPMFEMFRTRQLDFAPEHIEFWTPNPAVSAKDMWLTIQQQAEPLKPSSVVADVDGGFNPIVHIKTANVARLLIDQKAWAYRQIEIDGQTVTPPFPDWDWNRGKWKGVALTRTPAGWANESGSIAKEKNPHRGGPFKQVFDNRFMLVYGTGGTEAENAWARDKARLDAEMFYYRGNGAVDIVSDQDLDLGATKDRNILLYGNASTNTAWTKLLPNSPIKVSRGKIAMGDKTLTGNDLACLFVQPKSGSTKALVGVIAGTGLPGMHTTDRLPYLTSGVAYPDWTILSTDVLTKGAAGVRAAGFFGNDWNLSPDAAWNP